MVFKVKQNFLKTWLCIPCEQSGRNRGIPSDLSDKCKLQSCRKSEKKERISLKKNRFLLFLHQFLIMTWQEDLSICCCKIQKGIWVCYVDSFFRNKIRGLCLMKYGQAKGFISFHIFGIVRNHTYSLGEKIK